MFFQNISGTIDHRILLNFRVDPEVMARQLPREFKPKLVEFYPIS